MLDLTKIEVPYSYRPRVYTYKRGDTWWWKYKLPNDVWFYVPVSPNRLIAERNAALKAADLAKGLLNPKELEKMSSKTKILTFGEAVERYVDHLRLENSSANYLGPLQADLASSARALESIIGDDLLHRFREEHAYLYRDNLQASVADAKIRRVTAKNKLNNVKRMFKWLKSRKYIPLNPWLEVEAIKVPREEQARTVSISRETVKHVLDSSYVHRYQFPMQELLEFLFKTGARLSEALHVEIGDIDWVTGEWLIRPKSCPTKHGASWRPKFGRQRLAYVPKELRTKLMPFVDRAQRHKVVGYCPDVHGKKSPAEAKFLFTMLDRTLSTSKQPVYRRVDRIAGGWKSLFVSAGIDQDSSGLLQASYTRHDMRRGFNESVRNAGIAIEDRCNLLGHDPMVNDRHYQGSNKLKLDKIAGALDDVFAAKVAQ